MNWTCLYKTKFIFTHFVLCLFQINYGNSKYISVICLRTTWTTHCRRSFHDDVIKWKHLIFAWIAGWANNRAADDLRRHRAQYDVIVMLCPLVFEGYYCWICYLCLYVTRWHVSSTSYCCISNLKFYWVRQLLVCNLTHPSEVQVQFPLL